MTILDLLTEYQEDLPAGLEDIIQQYQVGQSIT